MPTLAQMIKAKHPGSYDDMKDADLEKAILAKHPEYQDLASPPEQPVGVVPSKQSDTFMGGFTDSLMNGEALRAGAKGGLGYLKGAVTDLPSSLAGGLKAIANAALHPIDTISNAPSDIANMASNISSTFSHAGSNPEAFGELMGQLTGQPVVTHGLIKGVPAGTFGMTGDIPSGLSLARDAATTAKPYVGSALEATGGYMREHQPLSGLIPRIAEPRTLRNFESSIGGGIEDLGKRMQVEKPATVQINPSMLKKPAPTRKYAKVPVKQGEVVTDAEYTQAPSSNKELGAATSRQTPPTGEAPKRLNSATNTDSPTPTGVKPKPQTGTGPFTAEGDVDLKSLPKVVTEKLHNMIDEAFGSSADTADEATSPEEAPIDSRISGLPPEESPAPMVNRSSEAVNRAAASTGPNLLNQLSQEANRFGMSIEDYITSLRRGGGESFVMPSAEMPRVR